MNLIKNIRPLYLALIGGLLVIVIIIINDLVISSYLTSKLKSEEEKNIELAESNKPKLYFTDIKNILITLSNHDSTPHYVLIDLALTTANDESKAQLENDIVFLKSIVVSRLTHMDFDTLNEMSVEELSQLLLTEFQQGYQKFNITPTFNDVMISKIIFQ